MIRRKPLTDVDTRSALSESRSGRVAGSAPDGRPSILGAGRRAPSPRARSERSPRRSLRRGEGRHELRKRSARGGPPAGVSGDTVARWCAVPALRSGASARLRAAGRPGTSPVSLSQLRLSKSDRGGYRAAHATARSTRLRWSGASGSGTRSSHPRRGSFGASPCGSFSA